MDNVLEMLPNFTKLIIQEWILTRNLKNYKKMNNFKIFQKKKRKHFHQTRMQHSKVIIYHLLAIHLPKIVYSTIVSLYSI